MRRQTSRRPDREPTQQTTTCKIQKVWVVFSAAGGAGRRVRAGECNLTYKTGAAVNIHILQSLVPSLRASNL